MKESGSAVADDSKLLCKIKSIRDKQYLRLPVFVTQQDVIAFLLYPYGRPESFLNQAVLLHIFRGAGSKKGKTCVKDQLVT